MGRLLLYLIDLIVLVLALARLSRAFRHLIGEPRVHFWRWGSDSTESASRPTLQREMVRDPLCGMFVSTELSHRLKLGDRTLHFCSRECLERYQKNPSNA